LGISTEIRLRQLQYNEWLYENPLEIWEYENVNSFRSSIIAQTLCLAKPLGLAINTTSNTTRGSYKLEPGSYPILWLLQDDYRKHKESLKLKEIMFVEQLVYSTSMEMRKWDELDKIYKGKIPIW